MLRRRGKATERLFVSEVLADYTRHRSLETKTKFTLGIREDLYVIKEGLPTSKRVFKQGEVVNALLCVYSAGVENNFLTKVQPTIDIVVLKNGKKYILFSETSNTECDTFINSVGEVPEIISNLIKQLRKDFLHIGEYKEFYVGEVV